MKTKIITCLVSLLVIGGILGYKIEMKEKNVIIDSTKTSQEENNNTQNENILSEEETSGQSEEKVNSEEKKTSELENKNTTITNNLAGRLEIPALNKKVDLISSQIKSTTSGLNKVGNTIIALEDTSYQEITKDTEIYIRNEEQEKIIYKVYNISTTSLTDTTFYEKTTDQIEITLVVKTSDNKNLVIQAKNQ